MIQLTSYLHRDLFRQIVARWFIDDLRESDALDVKYIVNFNSILAKRVLRRLSERIFRDVYGVEPRSTPVQTKGALKDYVADHPTITNAHVEDLIRLFRTRPEDFYKETPADARIFFAQENGHPLFLGTARLKRLRRIAEKGARRISDYVYQQIRDDAEHRALARARQHNVPLQQLTSSREEMIREFTEAEDHTRQTIKHHRLPILDQRFDIHDVAGLKLVAEPDVHAEILRYIREAPDLRLLELEEHRGIYNATNLIVEVTLDRQALLDEPLDEHDKAVLELRGFSPMAISHDLRTFVESGDETITLEIILSDFVEFLESEIGRCQHEVRIRAQRQTEIYRGPLSKNTQYLLTYLFAFAISPQTTVPELPIKVWGNYVPDYVDQIVRKLYNVYDFTLGF